MLLKKGSKGADVKIIQGYLGLIQDGIFGVLTEEAVIAFQLAHGLTPDGIVGDKTIAVMRGDRTTKRPVKEIILHCTATKAGQYVDVATIRRWHKAQGWSDIGYHYVIYADGSVHVGRDINKIGSHCVGHNTGTIGVVYVGGLDEKGNPKDTRTNAQKVALVNLVKKLMSQYKLDKTKVRCHNEFSAKACPCFKIEDFRKELK